MLGSPSKSPLLSRLGDTPKAQALRMIVDEDDEDAYITPRGVRQRAKGLPLPPMATVNAAAVFRGAQLPASSSAPSLVPKPVEAAAVPSSLSSLHGAGLSHAEISSDATALVEEDQIQLPQPKHVLASDLPLPSFYSSLLTLHVALEHALVVHLATAGCASATLESSAQLSDDDLSDSVLNQDTERRQTKTVRLPNLISYTALRPLVERSGGRRLGPTELKRLASVWVDFHRSSSASSSAKEAVSRDEDEEVRGLGFIVSKTRSMDPRTGRRALDWGIGIELEIKRSLRPRTPPTQVNFGGVQVQSSPLLPSCSEGFDERLLGTPKMPATRCTTPPPSSERKVRSPFIHSSPLLSSPRRKPRANSPTPSKTASSPKLRSSTSMGAAKAREGMSVVAMWNNGLETRKAEVGRRLRERCARYHQLWLDEQGISVPRPSAAGLGKTEGWRQEPATPSRREQQEVVGLGIAAGPVSDTDHDDDHARLGAAPPREVVMGAGGLLTPSATRSGGPRLGKRTFYMDPSELDRAGLTDDESDDAEQSEVLAAGPSLKGKQSLIDEVSSTVVRSSKSMPRLHSAPDSTATSVATVAKDEAGEVPMEGTELHRWHPEFPLDDPRVVRPVPLATLPSLAPGLSTPHRNKDRSLFGAADPPTPSKPIKYIPAVDLASATATTSSALTLRERIAAKEQLRRTASLPSLTASSSGSMTPMQALSQRALVSRLPEFCSILFMLFSNGTTLSSNGITRSPTLPMQDLLAKLAKSVKIHMSTRECRQAIDVLGRIAPGFLMVISPSTDGGSTGGNEFVRMGHNHATGAVWRLNDIRARIASELNGSST